MCTSASSTITRLKVDVALAGIHPRPDGGFVHHHTRVREEPDVSVAIGPAA